MPELPAGAEFLGIAQYIPAKANAVSTISTVLFMGESPGRRFHAGRSICLRLAAATCG